MALMGPSQNPSALSKERLTELFDRLGVPPQGRQLVQRAMVEAPVRDVTSSGRNVVTHFHSRKLGTWVGTESGHVEFPAAVGFENDTKVLAYFPQPFTRKFEYVDPDTGEIHTVRYTPDYLVLQEDGITVVECKPHQTLLKEAQRYPFKFRQADDGSWYSPLFEAALAELGLRFRIVTEQSFSRVWVENCQHLADYMGEAAEPCPDDVLAQGVLAMMKKVYDDDWRDGAAKNYTTVYRTQVLHFDRYREDNDTDIVAFKSCIQWFEKALPELFKGNLLPYSDVLHENTLGCVGTLRDVLCRAARFMAAADGWSPALLQRGMLTDAQRNQILEEILEGEEAINPGVTLAKLRKSAAKKVA